MRPFSLSYSSVPSPSVRSPDMTEFLDWDIKPYLNQSIQINITAILIQRILVFQAKFLLFMTFWKNID